jgi:hypothetical protein
LVLATLASHVCKRDQAYALPREERYAAEVRRHLLSWLESNPIARGVNWHSALELGVRLIAWVWIERLLRALHPLQCRRIVESIRAGRDVRLAPEHRLAERRDVGMLVEGVYSTTCPQNPPGKEKIG